MISHSHLASGVCRKKSSVVLCVSFVPLWWMFFLVISPQRHRASQSLHREIHFSDRLLKRGVNETDLVDNQPVSYRLFQCVNQSARHISFGDHGVAIARW